MENNRRNRGRRYLDNNKSAMVIAYGVIGLISGAVGFLLAWFIYRS